MNKPLRLPNSENLDRIAENRLAHSVRVIVVRPNRSETVEYDLLLAQNSYRQKLANRDQSKSGKYEFPGGKVYETEEERLAFAKISPDDREEILRIAGARELEEEIGMSLNPDRFVKLKTLTTPIEGEPYENFPEAEYFRTTYYTVVLGEDEYTSDFPETWTAQQKSDDIHIDRHWEPVNTEDFADSDIIECYAGKTRVILEKADEITQAIEEARTATTAKVSKVLTNVNSVVHGGEIRDKKQVDEQKGEVRFSLLDLDVSPEIMQSLALDDFTAAYERHFEQALDAPEISRVRRILLDQCLKAVLDKTVEIEMISREERSALQNYTSRAIGLIKTPRQLFQFYKRCMETEFGKRVIRALLGYGKISQLPYFDYIDSESKKFNEKLEATLTDPKARRADAAPENIKRKRITSFEGDPCYLVIDSNTKTLERMVAKSSIKVEVDPRNIKDVFRGRIVVRNANEIDAIVTFMQKKFGNSKSESEDSWQLEPKVEAAQNALRDEERQDTKLLGSYLVPGTDIRIPIEFQIMTEEQYKRSESGPKFHTVYAELLQALFEETRPITPVNQVFVELKIQALADDKALQKSYTRLPNNPDKRTHIVRKEIATRLSQFTFQNSEGDYLAYQNVIRCMGIPDLVEGEDEAFFQMAEALNDEIGCRLYALHWRDFFKDSTVAASTYGPTCIGIHFLRFVDIVTSKKFGVKIEDSSTLLGAFIINLNELCDVSKPLNFWKKLLTAPATLSDRDKKFVRNKNAQLKAGLKDVLGFNLDTLNI